MEIQGPVTGFARCVICARAKFYYLTTRPFCIGFEMCGSVFVILLMLVTKSVQVIGLSRVSS